MNTNRQSLRAALSPAAWQSPPCTRRFSSVVSGTLIGLGHDSASSPAPLRWRTRLSLSPPPVHAGHPERSAVRGVKDLASGREPLSTHQNRHASEVAEVYTPTSVSMPRSPDAVWPASHPDQVPMRSSQAPTAAGLRQVHQAEK